MHHPCNASFVQSAKCVTGSTHILHWNCDGVVLVVRKYCISTEPALRFGLKLRTTPLLTSSRSWATPRSNSKSSLPKVTRTFQQASGHRRPDRLRQSLLGLSCGGLQGGAERGPLGITIAIRSTTLRAAAATPNANAAAARKDATIHAVVATHAAGGRRCISACPRRRTGSSPTTGTAWGPSAWS